MITNKQTHKQRGTTSKDQNTSPTHCVGVVTNINKTNLRREEGVTEIMPQLPLGVDGEDAEIGDVESTVRYHILQHTPLSVSNPPSQLPII
jgi:hypothetical protein